MERGRSTKNVASDGYTKGVDLVPWPANALMLVTKICLIVFVLCFSRGYGQE